MIVWSKEYFKIKIVFLWSFSQVEYTRVYTFKVKYLYYMYDIFCMVQ